jgi:hypothetical protein
MLFVSKDHWIFTMPINFAFPLHQTYTEIRHRTHLFASGKRIHFAGSTLWEPLFSDNLVVIVQKAHTDLRHMCLSVVLHVIDLLACLLPLLFFFL